MDYWTVEECCEILDSMRVPITASDRKCGPYPYYGANGIQDHVAEYIFDDELVLLAEDGGNFGSKERPIAYRVSGKCWVNNHAHVLRPKKGLDVDYLCYSLMFYDVSGLVNGATRQKLTQADMRKMLIPMRSIAEQKDIVQRIRAVERIIASRQRQLRALDTLIKARFVEMFGDPETNPMGWEQVTLGDVCSSIVRGPFGSALKKEFFVDPDATTYKVYEQKHAIQKSATIGTYYITAEKFNELRRFECVAGDILMSCSGTMGELYQLPEGCERGIINQALCKLTLNEKILPVCFLVYMRQTIGNLETKGSGIQNIAAVSYLKAMPINLPPMKVQEAFATFVSQVDKSKVVVQKALEEAQLLFDSLMQKYFD
ncbi:MAG: restriction endonuclease subunit S [Clostridia bacterium]|nr:restriction endonuclease subunit S [Clostridia bacterium]